MSFPSNIALNNLFLLQSTHFVRAVFSIHVSPTLAPAFTIGPSIAFTYRPSSNPQ